MSAHDWLCLSPAAATAGRAVVQQVVGRHDREVAGAAVEAERCCAAGRDGAVPAGIADHVMVARWLTIVASQIEVIAAGKSNSNCQFVIGCWLLFVTVT